MGYLLLDTFINSYTKYSIFSYLYIINFMSLNSFIPSLLLLYLITNDIIFVLLLLSIYILNHLVFRYIRFNLISSLPLFIVYYIIIFGINSSLIINVLIVILLYFNKYNKLGDIYKKVI